MTIQYDNLNSTISAVGTATNIPVNIQTKGTGGLNLLGSGQNLLLNSNSFTNATYWGGANASITGSQADPFGGTTAALLTADGTTNNHSALSAQTSFVSGVTYTSSAYFKAGTNNFVQIRAQGAIGAAFANFDISTGVAGTTSSSSSITSIGNGWYRCALTFTATASANSGFQFYIVTSNTSTSAETNTLTTTIFMYGAQTEIGLVANTLILTTTAAIYGTPQLTFSGVASLGLQSDGSLYVQPAGTGAIQTAPTTSTAVGGNARGTNAVDWQTARGVAGQVSSGAYSSIGGGFGNSAFSFAGSVVGGYGNGNAGGFSFIGGGNANAISAGTILVYTAIVGGNSNTANGFYNFIGGGFTNSGTSITAVTTQSATMNGTTAVTLSGSNANIKVGQYISGTSIGSDTYVAAISGTSLTLSKVATGSSTSTLTFYTPHGVVVGGGNNQATGSYSFIGGGGDAGTAGNRNVASGDWSTVGGGIRNVASGVGSFVGGGGTYGVGNIGSNTASNSGSCVVGGFNNTSSGFISSLVGGNSNTANSQYCFIGGGAAGTTRSIVGNHVFPACDPPIAFASGVSQAALLILGRQTTDATPTVLTSNASAATTNNQVILPNNSAYFFRGEVISGVTGGGDTKGWTIEGVIKRGANAASTALVGTPTVTSSFADAGASTWTIAVTADTTNGGLTVTFTGQAATTIRTVAQIRTTEMTY